MARPLGVPDALPRAACRPAPRRLHHQQHREPQPPGPQGDQNPRTLPRRASRHQAHLPRDHASRDGLEATLPLAKRPQIPQDPLRRPTPRLNTPTSPDLTHRRSDSLSYQAAIAVLSVRNRISRRDLVELCEQLFGSRISTGTVDAILARTADALTEPCDDILARVRSARAVNMDETGWRLRGGQRALWGMFSERHAIFEITASRHDDHAKHLLRPSRAVVTSDRWWAYNHLPLKRRQICWSHLKRDFEFHAEGRGSDKQIGQAGLAVCEELFWTWEIYTHTGDRAELQRRVRVLQRQLKAVLREHASKHARYRQSRRFARALLKIWPALWTFAKHPGVQPTNNHAERALRGAVIYRKLSLGSQSEHGEQRIARLLSAHTTCRLQHRSLHAYLIDALSAHARGDPAPLLA